MKKQPTSSQPDPHLLQKDETSDNILSSEVLAMESVETEPSQVHVDDQGAVLQSEEISKNESEAARDEANATKNDSANRGDEPLLAEQLAAALSMKSGSEPSSPRRRSALTNLGTSFERCVNVVCYGNDYFVRSDVPRVQQAPQVEHIGLGESYDSPEDQHCQTTEVAVQSKISSVVPNIESTEVPNRFCSKSLQFVYRRDDTGEMASSSDNTIANFLADPERRDGPLLLNTLSESCLREYAAMRGKVPVYSVSCGYYCSKEEKFFPEGPLRRAKSLSYLSKMKGLQTSSEDSSDSYVNVDDEDYLDMHFTDYTTTTSSKRRNSMEKFHAELVRKLSIVASGEYKSEAEWASAKCQEWTDNRSFSLSAIDIHAMGVAPLILQGSCSSSTSLHNQCAEMPETFSIYVDDKGDPLEWFSEYWTLGDTLKIFEENCELYSIISDHKPISF